MLRKCPICNSEKREVLFDISFAKDMCMIYGLSEKNYISVCEDCGFTYACNDASQANYDNYYKNSNNYADDKKIKLSEGVEHEIIPLIEKYVSKESSIIDIGSGDGSLLISLKNRNFINLCGMDPGHDSAEMLRASGIDCYEQSIFETIPQHAEHIYDVVISTCVAEHIFDLREFVQNNLNLVKKDGMIIIQVPAVEGFEKVYSHLPNYFNIEHINYFSLQSLDNLFKTFGMERINSSAESIFVNAVGEYMLSGIYKYGGDKEIDKDHISEKSIKNYYSIYLEKKNNEEKSIEKFVNDNEYIVLWGCGSYATQMLAQHDEWKNKIVYAVDNNSHIQKGTFCGIKVFSPKKLLEKPYPVLICSMNNSNNIIDEIRELNIDIPYKSI